VTRWFLEDYGWLFFSQGDLLNAIPVLQRNIDHTAAQHTEIVDAILAGDTGRAQRAVAEHVDGTGALLRGFLATP